MIHGIMITKPNRQRKKVISKACSSRDASRTMTFMVVAQKPARMTQKAARLMGGSVAKRRSMSARETMREGANPEEGRSDLELRQVLVEGERLGIGERLDVLHRAAVHDIAHRQLDDLAALSTGNV